MPQHKPRKPKGHAAGLPLSRLIIVDQRTHRLLAGSDYSLPGIDAIAGHGVRFENHFIASAMCTPSRATFLTGRPPQYHHVIDQMQYPYVPTLDPKIPNVASVLKGLGYKTEYFGKFEMDRENLYPKPTVNYSTTEQAYGIDVFSAGGDIGSDPLSGFDNDTLIAGESVSWLRVQALESRRTGQPFFMVASFVNPHDIMFGDGNISGQPRVQKPVAPEATPPPPPNSIYENRETILRMNQLLNDLIKKEVGVNDGKFLTQIIGPK